MKTYVFSIVMNILIVTSLSGKIVNGYEPDINVARDGLKKLNELMNKPMSPVEKQRLTEHRARLKDFVLYHELTQRLLFQFKLMFPGMYNAVDSIKDAESRSVDVYVKFLPIEKMVGNVAGTANVPLDDEGNIYSSNYGPHTVSISIVAENHALSLLAHEFGHVKYLVPNIATYRKFYIKHYNIVSADLEGIGHHHMDPSGQTALEFEKQFRLNLDSYLKNNGARPQRVMSLIESIEKNLEFLTSDSPLVATLGLR